MKVSVCIPTYNQGAYIENTILSCVRQTHQPFEIIVSNDCSTDNTISVLNRLATEIPNLKIIDQQVNLGMVYNADFVLKAATGDYLIKLDSDDYLAPEYISKLATLLDQHPEAGYAHANVQEIDGQGIYKTQRLLARRPGFYSADKALRDAIRGYQVAANIVMFRRKALEQVGFITAKTNFAEDYYLSAELAAAGYGNVFSSEILSYYRVWADAGQVRQRRKMAEITALRTVFEEVLEPAYRKRNWDLAEVKASRANFACSQSDCLGWKLYNRQEKQELATELALLSSAPKARFFASLYLKQLGGLVNFFSKFKSVPKSILKTAYLLLRVRQKNSRG